jgi:transposase
MNIVGVDVSKDRLDLFALPSMKRGHVANDASGHAALVTWCQRHQAEIVVFEATGAYEFEGALALARENIPVAIVNPVQTRRYAQALGKTEKTDRIDAEIIARYADAARPKARVMPDEACQELTAKVVRRRQITEMLTAERNRAKQARTDPVRHSIAEMIEMLEKQLRALDTDIHGSLQHNADWKADIDLLRTVPGVGPVLGSTLVAELPELKTLGTPQVAKLVGVAPMVRQSGKRDRPRAICGGRATVRAKLYMGTLAATRFNPVIREFYQRLLARGKAKKVAIVACMRKLLGILGSMLRHRQPWDAEHAMKTSLAAAAP